MNTEYDVTVVEHTPGKPDLKQTVSGGAKTTAAWLRALADELDPRKPVLRDVSRGVPGREALSPMERG